MPPELRDALNELAKRLAQQNQQQPFEPFEPVRPREPEAYQPPLTPPPPPPYEPPYEPPIESPFRAPQDRLFPTPDMEEPITPEPPFTPSAPAPYQPPMSPLQRAAAPQPTPPVTRPFMPVPEPVLPSLPGYEPFAPSDEERFMPQPMPFEERIEPQPFTGLEPGPSMGPPEAPVMEYAMPLPQPVQPLATPFAQPPSAPAMGPMGPQPFEPTSGLISELPGPFGREPTMGLPPPGSEVPRSPFPMPQSFEDEGMLPQAPPESMREPLGGEPPISPLAALAPAPSAPRVVPPEGYPAGTMGSIYVPGSTLPEGVDPLAPLQFTEEQGKAAGNALALASLIPPNAFGNMYVGDAAFGGGPPIDVRRYERNVAEDSVGGQGSLYEEGALAAAKAAAQDPYSGLWGANLQELVTQDPNLKAMVDAKVARDLDRIAKVEKDYEQMKPLSDLLKSNDFKKAFEYAKEQGLTDRLMKADWLSQLRQPFTPEEMQQFYNAIPPDYAGKNFNFDPQGASKRAITSMGATPKWAGYPDPQAAFIRKEDDTVKKAVSFGIDLMLAAAGVPPLTAGLTKATYTLAETGGDIGAAIRAGAASAIGTKIGEVVRAGLPGANIPSSAANVAEKAATDAITRGIGGEALEEVVITALRPTLGSALASTVASNAVKSALQEAPDFVRNGTEPDVEEIIVQGSKFKPNLGSALASVGQGGVQDIFSERQIAEFQEAEARGEDPTQPEELEEVEVTARRQPPPSLVAPVVGGALTEAFKPSPSDALEEVTVTAKKPQDRGIVTPPLSELPDIEYPTGPDGLPEVTVESPKPTDRELVVPPLEMLDVKPEDILKDYKPTEVKQSKLKSLLDKVGGINNLLKLLSAIQAARSGRQAPSTGGGGLTRGGGMGGALPKYSFQRTALKPDIDYYTYGTRPEVPFFEDTMTGPDSGPATGILPPKDRPPVFAMGGLAEGGMSDESESRYVEGPGSGREDKIPALLSDGEYVIDAETLALLGDGSTKEGARRMDDFRAKIRQHKGRALSRGQISPNAKSPEKYMGGGLT